MTYVLLHLHFDERLRPPLHRRPQKVRPRVGPMCAAAPALRCSPRRPSCGPLLCEVTVRSTSSGSPSVADLVDGRPRRGWGREHRPWPTSLCRRRFRRQRVPPGPCRAYGTGHSSARAPQAGAPRPIPGAAFTPPPETLAGPRRRVRQNGEPHDVPEGSSGDVPRVRLGARFFRWTTVAVWPGGSS